MPDQDDLDNSNQLNKSTDNLQTKPANKSNGKHFCKRISKFLFSHIGLLLIVIVYAVAGAFLFELLEKHREAKDCQEGKGAESANIVNLKSNLLTYIQFNISSIPSDTTKDNETEANRKIEEWLTSFRDQVLDIRTTYRYTGQNCENTKWTFAGSLLFVVTIFTTIGYGHIAPVTWEGQIVCICYATIGIPLFLMFLSNISGVLGDMFRYLYARVCCRLCFKKKKKDKKLEDSDNQNKTEDGNNLDKQVVLDSAPQWTKENNVKVVDDNENLDPDLKEDDQEEKVNVPLTVTMIILTLYIAIGAALFNQFEQWSPIEAAYFCYITLTTIGFGDFVPGQKENDPQQALKLTLGSIYLLFGMAILAMCFDLMQEEIIAKFTWLGKKLGIVEKDEDDEEEEQIEKNKEKEKKEKEKELNKEENKDTNKKKPSYISDKHNYNDGESPVPSYSQTNDDRENMSRLRSSYFQNVIQRQYKS